MLKASKHEALLKIRSPHRVVADYDVDRLQVQGQQCPQPSNTNRPNPFLGIESPKKPVYVEAKQAEAVTDTTYMFFRFQSAADLTHTGRKEAAAILKERETVTTTGARTKKKLRWP